jgi:hypothetical protein
MPFTPRQIEVLTKYQILLPDGSRRQTVLVKGGPGPLISDEALNFLLSADTTPNGEWLDWIFFQAGGGEAAVGRRKEALEFVKNRFIDDQTNGFDHPVTHVRVPPRPLAEVEARWEKALPVFLKKMEVLDEDALPFVKMDSFGYKREMPGRGRVYTTLVAALTAYLAIAKKAVKSDFGPARPANVNTIDSLIQHTKKVVRSYAAKDIRHAGVKKYNDLVYSDDFIEVMVPLTFPASVRYGHAGWKFSSPDELEAVIHGTKGWSAWTQAINDQKFFAFLNFKVKVPVQVADQKQFELTNLALELPTAADLTTIPYDEWKVWDEHNRYELTIGEVKALIRSEPSKPPPSPDDEFPLDTGAASVTPEEAEETVRHLDMALTGLIEWSKDFDWKQLVPDLNQMPR